MSTKASLRETHGSLRTLDAHDVSAMPRPVIYEYDPATGQTLATSLAEDWHYEGTLEGLGLLAVPGNCGDQNSLGVQQVAWNCDFLERLVDMTLQANDKLFATC